MRALIPALFLTLSPTAPALAGTICHARGDSAPPLDQVIFTWGDLLPDERPDPFFGHSKQKVTVLLSGPRYHRAYESVAFHSTHSTRLGEQRSTSIQLDERYKIYFSEYPDMVHPGKAKFKTAYLAQNDAAGNQERIPLDCE